MIPRDRFAIDPDIRKASGPPPELYFEPYWFDRARDSVFARTWHCAGSGEGLERPGSLRPLEWLPGCLDEPLLLARDGEGVLRGLSNVCTHRGHRVASAAGCQELLRCPYHGRRFGLNGRLAGMPEFAGVASFPGPADDLAELPLDRWDPLLFLALDPAAPFAEWTAPARERMAFFPMGGLRRDAAASRAFEFDASWILYVDNYLEGFHIPFLHAGLAAAIDWKRYTTETFRWASLQIARAAAAEPAFDLPAGHPQHGERVAAFYWWLFPATMLNFYPWGLSLNVVEPLGPARTRVRFEAYVAREDLRGKGAGAGLDRVEAEDEAAALSCQRGMGSRFARRARYSPTQEAGTHHFHRLLADFLCKRA